MCIMCFTAHGARHMHHMQYVQVKLQLGRCAVLQRSLEPSRYEAPYPIFKRSKSNHVCHVAAGEEVGYDAVRYTRCNNNPSQEVVAAKLAALEGEQWVTLRVTPQVTPWVIL
jgi:hypothetical protein